MQCSTIQYSAVNYSSTDQPPIFLSGLVGGGLCLSLFLSLLHFSGQGKGVWVEVYLSLVRVSVVGLWSIKGRLSAPLSFPVPERAIAGIS